MGNKQSNSKSEIVEIWKKTIEVQQHFNDIELRIRNFALTVYTFIIASIGYLMKDNSIVTFGDTKIILPVLVGYIGSIIIWAFYFMDKYWYHNLLIGAVNHASAIEDKYRNELPCLSLSGDISKKSPVRIFGYELHSQHKITIFYYILIYTLLYGSTLFWIYNCNNHLVQLVVVHILGLEFVVNIYVNFFRK